VPTNLTLGAGKFRTAAFGNVPRLILGDDGPPGILLAGSPARAEWGASAQAGASVTRARWGAITLGTVHQSVRAPWGAITLGTVQQSVRAPWGLLSARVTANARAPWGRAGAEGGTVRAPWQRAKTLTQAVRAPWQRATIVTQAVRALWGRADPLQRSLLAPWDRALLVIGPNTDPPVYLPPAPPAVLRRVNLHFCPPGNVTPLRLKLGAARPCERPGGTTVVPARPVYMQTHVLTAVRLPDLTPVPITGFSLSADTGSIGWTLNAAGPLEILSLLAPAAGLPRRLRVTLDGLVWEFVVEGLRRTRSFGAANAQITGRSASALLSDPYSPPITRLNTVPMTAQQIIEDALQFTGVGLDWRCTDWTVPTGAWSHTGTAMEAVRRVADSIGAIVQSPRAGDNVIVMPRYPTLPWAWGAATPDVIVASLDPVVSEGHERADKPEYEGVYVSGQAQGVLALVKRTGTGPALYLPMVTDALITALVAARQRGESMLGAAGKQARMTLTLPVLTGAGESGVIDVGSLVEVVDPAGTWRGLVLSVSVTAERPSVQQTITLERHL
jgi:hypothetical protein